MSERNETEAESPAAAAGRVVFNVAATVRYPDQEGNPLNRSSTGEGDYGRTLREAGEAIRAESLANLNAIIDRVASALAEQLGDVYNVESVPDVGLEIVEVSFPFRRYILDVKEGY